MKSSAAKKYALKELFGKLLWGRHMAVELRDQIMKDKAAAVELNFAGVDFITRAFADEYLKMKQLLAEREIAVFQTNTGREVAKMLEHAVRPARHQPSV